MRRTGWPVIVAYSFVCAAPHPKGPVWHRTNDNTNHISNGGEQIVKVIVTDH
jgi:hypothetical protein